MISSECPSQHACINQKCSDPCIGSCGFDTKCHVQNHVPICSCNVGFTGDPFVRCSPIPPSKDTFLIYPILSIASIKSTTKYPASFFFKATELPRDLCNPSPCGANAECNGGVCTCIEDYFGNPYESCRPECVLNTDCSRDRACVKYKCIDPCPGTCGHNAICEVVNHIPVCSCSEGFTGDPFSNCRIFQREPEPIPEPCVPSPCGPNSQCRVVNGNAVCSCLMGYMGSPPQCRPECVVSSECSQNHACVNQKCIDPCIGTCGHNARCEVINHSPICSCKQGQTGDPFQRCIEIIKRPVEQDQPRDLCQPNPCGPNSVCTSNGQSPICQCLSGYFGKAPNCRPECTTNTDCPSDLSCVNNKCINPCPNVCGTGAECRVIANTVSCFCPARFTGNPFIQCVEIVQNEPINPCDPSPCGPNANCIQRDTVGSCRCIDDYFGNPYEGCRPECVLNSDCAPNKACNNHKCIDPCPGVCGQNAICQVVNHVPTCTCLETFVGDPFVVCHQKPKDPEVPLQPCQPSPCGPNSICREVNGLAVCSCDTNYIGQPPNCRPECTINAECPQDKACHKFKCKNPCAGTCGTGAHCSVINHNPICSCPSGMTGDPFIRCYEIIREDEPRLPPTNPCVPSPCGLYSQCRVNGDSPSCSCLPNYVGSPPNCRPECVVNTDCPSDKACIAEKCRAPCEGSCGFNTECRVQNHIPICSCRKGFTGDPFTQCFEIREEVLPQPKDDPCYPSPCGANTNCNNGQCTCLTNYFGDPYSGCRPECTLNTECSPNKACINNRCIDPCINTCGQNAICNVINHIPTCSCPADMSGDPFVLCRPVPRDETPKDPCKPSPCGPNSVCRVNNGVAVCSCQQGMIGSPPSCKHECVVSSECDLQRTCTRNKCVDPCPGTCGQNTECKVINHNPICSCISGYSGDPFVRCDPIRIERLPPQNPCVPSPCGPNSVCKVVGESPACSCLPYYVGKAPNCRPECTINNECSNSLACINQKCQDPCPGSCGQNAKCTVINHTPNCVCDYGYTGDPFQGCQYKQGR